MTNNISDQTEEFVKNFRNLDEEIIPWIDDDAVGLSIIKNYPENSLFVPARNLNGEPDSVALIKIGYTNSKNIEKEENNVNLFISISKVSRYLLNNHWNYDFKDPKSPTEESLKKSKESKQPIDLEDAQYQYNLPTKRFYNSEKKKYVEAGEIVEEIYKLHLKTLRAVGFRAKIKLQKQIIEYSYPINKLLIRTNFILFGRKIKESKNFSTGIFETYSHNDLIDLTTEKTKILGSDFPITNQTARTFVAFITVLFLFKIYSGRDILGIMYLVQKSSENNLLLASFTATLLFIFDRVIPHLILLLVNVLIRLRLWFMFWKIKLS